MSDKKEAIIDMTDWDENGEGQLGVTLVFYDKSIFPKKENKE